LEVIYAAAQAQGVSKEELEQIRLAKPTNGAVLTKNFS
jgi:predicted house-cleaning noncanonical NTP pyrophosphatase (MazG superfamily)